MYAKKTRSDGRVANTLRPLSCELGCLQNADGSALWKAGNTHVLASVHGPIAPRIAAEEHADQCRIQVIVKTSGASSSSSSTATYSEWETFLTRIITSCCWTTMYPRCIITITLHLLSQDGSVLAAALHAAISALMDAGIELRTKPVGVTCLLGQEENGSIWLDPTEVEEQQQQEEQTNSERSSFSSSSSIMLVLEDCNADNILACHSTNLHQSIDQILPCAAIAAKVSQAITAFWRIAIESKVKQESQTIFFRDY